jgi:hypothetical protein
VIFADPLFRLDVPWRQRLNRDSERRKGAGWERRSADEESAAQGDGDGSGPDQTVGQAEPGDASNVSKGH